MNRSVAGGTALASMLPPPRRWSCRDPQDNAYAGHRPSDTPRSNGFRTARFRARPQTGAVVIDADLRALVLHSRREPDAAPRQVVAAFSSRLLSTPAFHKRSVDVQQRQIGGQLQPT